MQEKTRKSKILIILFVGILLGITIEATGEIIIYLDDLYDVNTTGVVNGNVLKYNGSAWVPSTDLTGMSGTGNIFDQDLNTTNNVTFNNITLTLYPFLDKDYTNDFDGTWLSLTGKPTKAHPHNQDLNTTNNVTFYNITSTKKFIGNGSELSIDWNDIYYKPFWITVINQKSHPHNQDLNTTNAVTFSTVNTGQGANELYDMDQNVQISDNVIFNSISPTNQVRARAYVSGASVGWSVWNNWKKANISVESYDIGNNFNTGSYKFTAPTTGYYLVIYGCGIQSLNDKYLMASAIYVGGVSYGGMSQIMVSSGLPQAIVQQGSDICYVTSGTDIELYAYVSGGSGKWNFTPNSTYITIYQLV